MGGGIENRRKKIMRKFNSLGEVYGGGGAAGYKRSTGWSLGEHRASAVGKGTVKATVSAPYFTIS
jgi:hypothetical protein